MFPRFKTGAMLNTLPVMFIAEVTTDVPDFNAISPKLLPLITFSLIVTMTV